MQPFRWRDRWNLLFHEADRRSLALGGLAFLLHLGFGCGMASANALFVSRVGTEPLFYAYLGASVLTFLFAAAIYYGVDSRFRHWIFLLSFLFFSSGVFCLWALIGRRPELLWPVFAARIASDVLFVLALLQFWLLAGDRFTHFEARRRFPWFVAVGGLGYMAGAWLLQKFSGTFPALDFLLVWAGLLAIAPLFLVLLPRQEASPAPAPEAEAAAAVSTASAHRLLKTLFVFCFAFTFFLYGVDYLFNTVALQALSDENRLAAFYGRVSFFSLLGVLLFQALMAGPLSRVLSVDRSMLVLCFALFLGIALLTWHPSLATAAFAEGLLLYFLDSKAVGLLQPVGNLFPDRLRGRAKVLLDGFAPPSGDLVLLLVATALAATVGAFRLAYVLAAGSLVFLLYPWLFRRHYLAYLLDCLASPDANQVLNAAQALGEPDKKAAAPALLRLLEDSSDPVLKRHLILSLGRMRSEAALPQLIAQFSQPHEALQLAVVEALGYFRNYPALFALHELMKSQDNVSFQVRMSATRLMTEMVGRRMIPLLREALAEENPRIQANALESLALLRRKEIVPLVLPFLNSGHRRLRANAAIALYPFRAHRAAARRTVAELFRSPDPLTRFAGIYAIGELRLAEYETDLKGLLGASEPRQRRAVLTALAKLGGAEYVRGFSRGLAEEDEVAAAESLQALARFPAPSRWRVFEEVSRMGAPERKRILARLDQSPFDFSQERSLLVNREALMFLPKR